MPKVFERFFRSDDPRVSKQTGSGLEDVVRSLVASFALAQSSPGHTTPTQSAGASRLLLFLKRSVDAMQLFQGFQRRHPVEIHLLNFFEQRVRIRPKQRELLFGRAA